MSQDITKKLSAIANAIADSVALALLMWSWIENWRVLRNFYTYNIMISIIYLNSHFGGCENVYFYGFKSEKWLDA